jgi:argininosuccinate lyase
MEGDGQRKMGAFMQTTEQSRHYTILPIFPSHLHAQLPPWPQNKTGLLHWSTLFLYAVEHRSRRTPERVSARHRPAMNHKIRSKSKSSPQPQPQPQPNQPIPYTMSAPKAVAENMLWGGRFTRTCSNPAPIPSLTPPTTEGLDPLMVQYNMSLPYDRVLWHQDIAGSLAFARANTKSGILSADEFAEIERGLAQIAEEWRTNSFVAKENDEDIHTANERRLSEVVGKEVGGKLHTGRSRNEQIATDMRLWLRDELRKLDNCLADLVRVSIARAESEIDYIMPGYTHLQKAQPVRWSHWLLSHATAFASELQRLREVTRRVNRCPLGTGALAGNPFQIDREMMAKELGFEGLLYNSMNAVADRDFAMETMQWGSSFMLKISRWAEDLIVYSSLEFGFVRLSDAYSTGSSLMPQKKNAGLSLPAW